MSPVLFTYRSPLTFSERLLARLEFSIVNRLDKVPPVRFSFCPSKAACVTSFDSCVAILFARAERFAAIVVFSYVILFYNVVLSPDCLLTIDPRFASIVVFSDVILSLNVWLFELILVM